jgi:hypothetical protein
LPPNTIIIRSSITAEWRVWRNSLEAKVILKKNNPKSPYWREKNYQSKLSFKERCPVIQTTSTVVTKIVQEKLSEDPSPGSHRLATCRDQNEHLSLLQFFGRLSISRRALPHLLPFTISLQFIIHICHNFFKTYCEKYNYGDRKIEFQNSMDNLHVRLNFNLSKEKGIKHHS